MADEEHEMDGGFEDEPMDPEEGAELEEETLNEDAPDPVEGDGEEKQEQEEPLERPRKMTKYASDCDTEQSTESTGSNSSRSQSKKKHTSSASAIVVHPDCPVQHHTNYRKMVRDGGVTRSSGSRPVRRLIEQESGEPMSTNEVVPPTPNSTPHGLLSTGETITQAPERPKIEVHLVGGVLHSDQVHVATELRHIIESRVHSLGHTFAAMPSSHIQLWWLEFQRRFHWDESSFSTTAIRRAFDSALRRRYSSRTNEWRQAWALSRKRPTCVPDDYWTAWLQEWEKPEFKSKSAKYKQNRLSEPEGDGTGISKHIGGSRSTIDHAIDIRKKTGREPTKYDIFSRLHQRSDGAFTSTSAERTATEIKRAMENIRSSTQSEPDVDEVYTNVVLQKKNKLFGTGCFGKVTQRSGSSLASSQSIREQLREQVQQEFEKSREAMKVELRDEIMAELEQSMNAKIAEFMAKFPPPPPPRSRD